jgi:hypothetical protein
MKADALPLFPDLAVPAHRPLRLRCTSQRVEFRDATYWCAQMRAARDPRRKAECHRNMIAALTALTSGVGQ